MALGLRRELPACRLDRGRRPKLGWLANLAQSQELLVRLRVFAGPLPDRWRWYRYIHVPLAFWLMVLCRRRVRWRQCGNPFAVHTEFLNVPIRQCLERPPDLQL